MAFVIDKVVRVRASHIKHPVFLDARIELQGSTFFKLVKSPSQIGTILDVTRGRGDDQRPLAHTSIVEDLEALRNEAYTKFRRDSSAP